jgi:hypothetical protein
MKVLTSELDEVDRGLAGGQAGTAICRLAHVPTFDDAHVRRRTGMYGSAPRNMCRGNLSRGSDSGDDTSTVCRSSRG